MKVILPFDCKQLDLKLYFNAASSTSSSCECQVSQAFPYNLSLHVAPLTDTL